MIPPLRTMTILEVRTAPFGGYDLVDYANEAAALAVVLKADVRFRLFGQEHVVGYDDASPGVQVRNCEFRGCSAGGGS